MQHVILTCKNHPELRWCVKEIAWTNGRYNGLRHIHFFGVVQPNSLVGYTQVKGNEIIRECPCSPDNLIEAPEQTEMIGASTS